MRWRRSGSGGQGWVSTAALLVLAVVTALLVVLAWRNAHPASDRDARYDTGRASSTPDPTSPSPTAAPSTPADLTLPSGRFTAEVVGDLLARGTGASSPRKALPGLLQTALDADRRKATVQLVPASLDDPKRAKQAITDAGAAGLVVVELGTAQVGSTDATKLRGGLRGVLKAARTESPDAPLVCLGVWAPSAQAADYDQQIESACKRVSGRFIKLSDLAERTDSAAPNSPVPNDTGQAQLTDRILAAIGVPTPS